MTDAKRKVHKWTGPGEEGTTSLYPASHGDMRRAHLGFSGSKREGLKVSGSSTFSGMRHVTEVIVLQGESHVARGACKGLLHVMCHHTPTYKERSSSGHVVLAEGHAL